MPNPENREPEAEQAKIIKKIETEAGEAVVRYASINDLEGILNVEQGIMVENETDNTIPKKVKESWWPSKLTPGKENRAKVIVLEIDGKIRGDIVIDKTIEEALQYAQYWVLTLGVDPNPKYRRMGLGTALLETAISETKNVSGAESLGLSVRANNTGAVKLYESMGFEPVKIFKGTDTWRGKPSDNIYMVKHF